MCISWNNKKCYDTIDARCKHEDIERNLCVTVIYQESLHDARSTKCNILQENLCLTDVTKSISYTDHIAKLFGTSHKIQNEKYNQWLTV